MSTLELISHYCKLLLPFATMAYVGLCAFIDKHRGWKLVTSLMFMGFWFAAGTAMLYSASGR